MAWAGPSEELFNCEGAGARCVLNPVACSMWDMLKLKNNKTQEKTAKANWKQTMAKHSNRNPKTIRKTACLCWRSFLKRTWWTSPGEAEILQYIECILFGGPFLVHLPFLVLGVPPAFAGTPVKTREQCKLSLFLAFEDFLGSFVCCLLFSSLVLQRLPWSSFNRPCSWRRAN